MPLPRLLFVLMKLFIKALMWFNNDHSTHTWLVYYFFKFLIINFAETCRINELIAILRAWFKCSKFIINFSEILDEVDYSHSYLIFILFPKIEYSEYDMFPNLDNHNATIHIHKRYNHCLSLYF